RRWDTWKRLRKLTLGGRGLHSLSGLEAFEPLEELLLLNTPTDDLSPLRDLPRLTEVTLVLPARGVDFASLAAVPTLRLLEIDTCEIPLPELETLARAP